MRQKIFALCGGTIAAVAIALSAAPLPPPRQPQPAWLREEGLVMAGNWESLTYRLRAGSAEPDTLEHRLDNFQKGYTEETALKLKGRGFNFVMLPLYKGFGLKAEGRQLEMTKAFAATCHALGLHVGVYAFSGTIDYESVFAEEPDAVNWLTRSADGKYEIYNWGDSRMYYRRRVNRSVPGVRALMRELVRLAVEEVKADLIHFDNYHDGPGYEPFSVQQFREFLKHKYTAEERERRFGFSTVDYIEPPLAPAASATWVGDPLIRDFIDYRATTQADTYRELSEYAHRLNPHVLIECNAGGYNSRLPSPSEIPSVDLFRMLPWGSAFWDEGKPSHLENGVLSTRFRSQKMGRQFGNLTFQYTSDPVGMAESLANNQQCAGCVLMFENGIFRPAVPNRPADSVDPRVFNYIQFFREHQNLYRDTSELADVGVLNTFEDNLYGPFAARRRSATLEQSLYQGKAPFALVPAAYPGDLSRFRVVVASDLSFLPADLLQALRAYVEAGGGLVLTGKSAQFAGWFPAGEGGSEKTPQISLGRGRIARLREVVVPEHFGQVAVNHAAIFAAIRWAAGGALSFEVAAPLTTTAAYYRLPSGARVMHLVNYDDAAPAMDIEASFQGDAHSVKLLSPDNPAVQSLSFEPMAGGRTHFRIQAVRTYAVVLIE